MRLWSELRVGALPKNTRRKQLEYTQKAAENKRI
jgi:hypothetical protein